MGRVLGQPSGLAGGRVGPGGRDIWDWVNQYWADLTKNVLFIEKRSFWPILAISGPSRPQKWIRLEILHRTMSVSCQLVTLVRFYDQKRAKINEYVRKC